MEYASVCYGEGEISVPVPAQTPVARYETRQCEHPWNEDACREGVKEIFSEPSVQGMVGAAKSICIIIDDNTRPTPSRLLISCILEHIDVGVQKVVILIALGAHAALDSSTCRMLTGDIPESYVSVVQHDAFSRDSLVSFGTSSFGTPISIHKAAAEADVRILTGMIKPHNQAGYTGGGKAVLPGTAGIDTILANHSCRYMAHPLSKIGVIEGNPIRGDIEEALTHIGPSVLINAVMDKHNNIISLVGGPNVSEAHVKGARLYDNLGRFEYPSQADLCLCGTPAPMDMNFYQMLNSLSAPLRVPKPAVKQGATVMVFGRASEGISDGDMFEALATVPRDQLYEDVFSDSSRFLDRPALHIFLECERYFNIVAVTEKSMVERFSAMGITALDVNDEDMISNYTLRQSGEILILADAPYAIIS